MATRCRARMKQIMSASFAVAADIIQKYYEVVDADDRTTHHESISEARMAPAAIKTTKDF